MDHTPPDSLDIPHLLDLAKAGCREAADTLIRSQWPWCKKQARLYALRFPAADRDELTQAGLQGVFHAIEYYDPVGGRTWAGYAQGCAVQEIARAARKATVHRHRYPLPDSAEVGDRFAAGPEGFLAAVPDTEPSTRWATKEGIDRVLEILPLRIRALVARVYGINRPSEPLGAVAKRLGMKESAAKIRLQSAILTLSTDPGLRALFLDGSAPEASPPCAEGNETRATVPDTATGAPVRPATGDAPTPGGPPPTLGNPSAASGSFAAL